MSVLPTGRSEPELVGTRLEWRRLRRLRGRACYEIHLQGRLLGRLTAVRTRTTSSRWLAEWGPARWELWRQGTFGARTCAAYPSSPAPTPGRTLPQNARAPLVTLTRTAFRRARVECASGTSLHWRQQGFRGARYTLALPDGTECVQAENTGGALRWTGEISVAPAAAALGDSLPLLVLFVVFVALNSSELHP